MSDNLYTVQQVPTEQCYALWKHVRSLLFPAIEESGGRWQPEYVFAALISGQHSLWVVTGAEGIVAAFTTELAHYPERRATVVHFLGGNGLDHWYPSMYRAVTDYARACGCDMIECTARAGFWPWFKEDGFERKAVFYEKKLTEE